MDSACSYITRRPRPRCALLQWPVVIVSFLLAIARLAEGQAGGGGAGPLAGRAALAGMAAAGSSLAADPGQTPGAGRRLLTGGRSAEAIERLLLSHDAWRPFPRARDREAWAALDASPVQRERKVRAVEAAEKLLGQPWPALSATLYMRFARDGDRSEYEGPYFRRRAALATLVLAECFEHQGRFLDEISNGVWAICEESTWCIPAHASRRRGDVLHRLDVEGLDLFACETGMSLALTLYLLEAELDAVSPTLSERIRREVARRIIEPYAAGDDFGSSGWIRGGNNWAPWCASNVLGAAMVLEPDPTRLARTTFRLMQVVDRFIDGYGDDGGCDEGPSYWSEAGGALLVFLELLRSRSEGSIDVYGQTKIAAIGKYILRAHMAGPWFANFSDADARAAPHPAKVYRFGERTGCEDLKALALLSQRGWRPDGPLDPPLRISGVSRPVLGPLMEIFWMPADARPSVLRHERTVWLHDVQILFAREAGEGGDSDRGLILAAKGGHNAESHNHNDVGHFILFLDGQPGIVDLGRETYSRKTFSDQRYELWFTRGLGHNAPVVGGVEQAAGRKFEAGEVRFEETSDAVRLSMRLDAAYPAAAGLRSLRRDFALFRRPEPRVTVRDAYDLAKETSGILVPLYAALEAKIVAPGRISIDCAPRKLLLEYDAGALEARIDPVPIEDAALRGDWGPMVWRIHMEVAKPAVSGSYQLSFRPEG